MEYNNTTSHKQQTPIDKQPNILTRKQKWNKGIKCEGPELEPHRFLNIPQVMFTSWKENSPFVTQV